MAADYRVYVDAGVVVVEHVGALQFDDTNDAIGKAAEAARDANSKRVLFDLRRAELANYYSYSVRHAEVAPSLGLDTSHKLAFVGERGAADILSFIERVTRNRGWKARCFFDMDQAFEFLQSAD